MRAARKSASSFLPTCAIAGNPTKSRCRSPRASSPISTRLISRTFGYAAPDAAVEVVNLRLRAIAPRSQRRRPRRLARTRERSQPVADRAEAHVVVGGRAARSAGLCSATSSARARGFDGPAIVVELSATAYVAPEFTLRVDDFGNLHLEARAQ